MSYIPPPPNRRFDKGMMDVGKERDARLIAASDRRRARRAERGGSLTRRLWRRVADALSTEPRP